MTDGLAVTYGEGRAEERRRAFEQQGASGEFLRVDATAAGLTLAGEVVTRIPEEGGGP